MNIVHFLDVLRDENHLSVSKLCDGICGRRSYYRYRDENYSIPTVTLEKLCARLNITVKELYSLHHEKTYPLYARINNLFYLIQIEDIKSAKELIDSININLIEKEMYNNIYGFILLKYQYLTKNINVIDYYNRLRDMISTQHITFDSFSSLDLMILFDLSKIEIKDESHDLFATKQLTDALLMVNVSTISNDSIHMVLPVYELIGQYIYKKGEYKQALEISYKGIELSRKFFSYQSLRSFYYLIGKISLEQKDYPTAEEYFHKCLYIISIKDNQEMFDLFKGFIITMLEEQKKTDMIELINKVKMF